VLYKGEQIAAILAETEEAAMEAVSKVKSTWKNCPVLDVEEALKPVHGSQAWAQLLRL